MFTLTVTSLARAELCDIIFVRPVKMSYKGYTFSDLITKSSLKENGVVLNRMECGHSGNRMLVKLADLALDKKTTIRDKVLYI